MINLTRENDQQITKYFTNKRAVSSIDIRHWDRGGGGGGG